MWEINAIKAIWNLNLMHGRFPFQDPDTVDISAQRPWAGVGAAVPSAQCVGSNVGCFAGEAGEGSMVGSFAVVTDELSEVGGNSVVTTSAGDTAALFRVVAEVDEGC